VLSGLTTLPLAASAQEKQVAVLHLTVSDGARGKLDADALASIEGGLSDAVHTVLPPSWKIIDSDMAIDTLQNKGVDVTKLDLNDLAGIAKAMQVDYVVTGSVEFASGFTGAIRVVAGKSTDVRREDVQADSATALRLVFQEKAAIILARLVASLPGEPTPVAASAPAPNPPVAMAPPPPVNAPPPVDATTPEPNAPPPASPAAGANPRPLSAPPEMAQASPEPTPGATPAPPPPPPQGSPPQGTEPVSATPAASEQITDARQFEEPLAADGRWIDIAGVGHVWSPYPGLVGADFRPYGTNGHWVYTAYGWTFESGYSWGWATFHYGRWWHDPVWGWVWLPGTAWGPAWVDWRYNDGVVGWAPSPPYGLYAPVIIGGFTPWCFVETRYLVEPNVTVYFVPRERVNYYYTQSRPVAVQRVGGGRPVYSGGPPVANVAHAVGRPITAQPVPTAARPRTVNALRMQNQARPYGATPARPAPQAYRPTAQPAVERPGAQPAYRPGAAVEPGRSPAGPAPRPAEYGRPSYQQPAGQTYQRPAAPQYQQRPAVQYQQPNPQARPRPTSAPARGPARPAAKPPPPKKKY
jgi:hypothetical protein